MLAKISKNAQLHPASQKFCWKYWTRHWNKASPNRKRLRNFGKCVPQTKCIIKWAIAQNFTPFFEVFFWAIGKPWKMRVVNDITNNSKQQNCESGGQLVEVGWQKTQVSSIFLSNIPNQILSFGWNNLQNTSLLVANMGVKAFLRLSEEFFG
jgi:hypothetical protein